MRITRRHLWVTCLAVGIAVPASIAVAASADTTATFKGLTTTVAVEKSTATDLIVRITAKNTSAAPISFLTRDLPQARQFDEDKLIVTRDGVEVAYRGRHAKPAPPSAADYTTLAPGAAYTVVTDVADDYDVSKPGTYAVRLASAEVAAAQPGKVIGVRSGPASVRTATGAKGTAKPAARAGVPTVDAKVQVSTYASVNVSFVGCSSSQQSAIKQAVADAYTYSTKSQAWLASNTSGGGLYKTWFGSYNSSRYNHVVSVFNLISNQLSGNKRTVLDCTNTNDPYYAYVYPNDHYRIYLCRYYWSAPARGYDSKAGTLIHESSHFDINGGSDDHVYGLDQGKRLASSSPSKAVRNADNIEHFAESF